MTAIITSPQNPRIKAVADLRESRSRRETGLILIDGLREIGRALDAGIAIDEAFCCNEINMTDAAQAMTKRLRENGATVTGVSKRVYEKIGYGDRADGVIVVAHRPRHELSELKLESNVLLAVIEGLEKPGNVGAICRSADGAGLDAIIVMDSASDPFGPNAIRASTGTIFTLPVIESTEKVTMEWLMSNHFQIIAASPHATKSYSEIDFRKSTAIILGSESKGLTETWKGRAIGARVPMKGRADSLNVSVTAALFFYEALRQRL